MIHKVTTTTIRMDLNEVHKRLRFGRDGVTPNIDLSDLGLPNNAERINFRIDEKHFIVEVTQAEGERQ